MKLIKYVLNTDGTVPSYIIDGGYFACKNDGIFPQDYDIVGVATNIATEESFANEAALLAYLQEKNFEYKNPNTEVVTPLETVVSDMWLKLDNN